MRKSSVSSIKRAQKEKLLFREVSSLFLQMTHDDPTVRNLIITRVTLSPDKSHCFVHFYTTGGHEQFKKLLGRLILYVPSLRKALADKISSRYVPEISFKYDAQFEKQEHIEQLLDQLKEDESL